MRALIFTRGKNKRVKFVMTITSAIFILECCKIFVIKLADFSWKKWDREWIFESQTNFFINLQIDFPSTDRACGLRRCWDKLGKSLKFQVLIDTQGHCRVWKWLFCHFSFWSESCRIDVDELQNQTIHFWYWSLTYSGFPTQMIEDLDCKPIRQLIIANPYFANWGNQWPIDLDNVLLILYLVNNSE